MINVVSSIHNIPLHAAAVGQQETQQTHVHFACKGCSRKGKLLSKVTADTLSSHSASSEIGYPVLLWILGQVCVVTQ